MKQSGEAKVQKAKELAARILSLARGGLLMELRFLDAALYRLTDKATEDTATCATDGAFFFYNIRHLLLSHRDERETIPRNLLHALFHCIFAHPFCGLKVDALRYDLACDIAVESAINELGLENLRCKRQNRQEQTILTLQRKLRLLTAERIYRYLLEQPLSDDEIRQLREDFFADDHGLWYEPLVLPGEASPSEAMEGGGANLSGKRRLRINEAAATLWQNLSRSLHMDLETFSKTWGSKAGTVVETLRCLLREKYDYRDFLKRFAVLRENMEINTEEFDYIFYTYGLLLYENMPLVEPLEYREEAKVRDFVIAIDTSASVSGKLVRNFLQKTYDILSDTESFFSRMNLHIIQCDTEIREDAVIHDRNEFDAYMEGLELKGFGGTDFRPVFLYVNELVAKHGFEQLKGLLYFSDGFGEFPLQKPAYETAFVFLEGEHNNFEVPPWAMKVVLSEDEVMIL